VDDPFVFITRFLSTPIGSQIRNVSVLLGQRRDPPPVCLRLQLGRMPSIPPVKVFFRKEHSLSLSHYPGPLPFFPMGIRRLFPQFIVLILRPSPRGPFEIRVPHQTRFCARVRCPDSPHFFRSFQALFWTVPFESKVGHD